ncbi:alpha-amylase MalA [Natranaeroarchaeum aerophilus]|uniref:Alpha-amylase family glycosyl hydrolase n=1 Tax=Natranaeroarchaeum aerophilus TaxID=2917711 RepID=A0AAE3K600_9EURY|nr:alpha-amylase MalA [Natranaeroarchaeum aerophilus]MCL9813880.1 alpha-amylase family glycosyl hydrolase [Natranaeroarchaeum aerophilus]
MHHPGPPRFEAVGSEIDLAPRDPDPSATYRWSVVDAPQESNATVGSDPVETFVPDQPGTYTIGLDAPDGEHRLTIRAFPASYSQPALDPAGSGPRSGSGFRSGSGLRPTSGLQSGSGFASGSGTSPGVEGTGDRPRIRLDGHVDGDYVVLAAEATPPVGSSLTIDDLDVEFFADNRDAATDDDITVDGHTARVPVEAIGEYSRFHAVAVAPNAYSVADAVGVDTGGDAVTVDRLNEPPEWGKNVTLYEIYVRTFSDGDEPTFQALSDRLDELADFGVDCIWLTPVLQNDDFDHGYNIVDFFSIADDLGSREEFESFIEDCHDHDIKVLFDLVMNHSAREHEFFKRAEIGDPEYRDWYEWEDPDNDKPGTYFDWPYIANFNFDNLEVRRHLLDAVDEWAPLVDGFRCDMAWAVPTSFWQELRDRVKSQDSEFLLLDETIPYIADFHELCFDVHFDTTLYHNLRQVGNGAMDASSITDAIENRARTGFPDHAAFLLYMENHDESRYAEECGKTQAKAAAGALFTLPGIPLLYAGQEIGEETRREKVDWHKADEDLRNHYHALVTARDELAPLSYDAAYEEVESEASHEGVVAYAREQDGERVVVVLNFGPDAEAVSVDEAVGSEDLLSGEDVNAADADVLVEDVVVVPAE